MYVRTDVAMSLWLRVLDEYCKIRNSACEYNINTHKIIDLKKEGVLKAKERWIISRRNIQVRYTLDNLTVQEYFLDNIRG